MFRASVLCFVAAVALQSVSALPNPEDLVKVENLLGAAKGKATGLVSQATQLLPTQATDAVSQVTGTVQGAAPGLAVRSCTTCGGKAAQEKTETETPTKPIGAAARCSLCQKRRAELAAQRKAEQQKSDDTATVPANVQSRHGKKAPAKKNGKSQGLTDAQKSANAQKAKSQNSGKSQKSAKAQAPGHTDATQGNKPGQNAKAQSTGKTQGLTDAQKSVNAQKLKSHSRQPGRTQKPQSPGKTQGLSDAQISANAQKAKATKSTSSKSGKKTE